MQRNIILFLACLFCAGIFFPGRAWAHKVKLFAAADGKKIEGFAYTSDGARIKRGKVAVMIGDNKIAEVDLDKKGEFTYEAKTKDDHLFRLDLGDGHAASFTVYASELPDSLPGGDKTVQATPDANENAAEATAAPASTATGISQDLAAEIKQLRQQVTMLREEIDAYREHRNLQDIIGGIGYILGITGIAFMLMKRNSTNGNSKA
ncbi:MAG: hypothetical protein JXR97_12945 [Planctomycetes bacterium]|nr:hypothetical protein [Planctomycetota bacterium]